MKEATLADKQTLLNSPVNLMRFIDGLNQKLKQIPEHERKNATIQAELIDNGKDIHFKIVF